MTLHELAEGLRKIAYDLDEASRRWDANDVHVVGLNDTIRAFTFRAQAAESMLHDAQAKLARKRPKRGAKKSAKSPAKRKSAR